MSHPENARQVALIQGNIRRFTGRVYPKLEGELSRLSVEALVDLARFISDAQTEVTRAKNDAIRQPWRR
jgi:hypothetical protein